MATKNDSTSTSAPASSNTFKRPRIGDVINVKAGAGRKVPNNEAGDYFSEKDAVPVTVNVRILRLLDDLDLIRTK